MTMRGEEEEDDRIRSSAVEWIWGWGASVSTVCMIVRSVVKYKSIRNRFAISQGFRRSAEFSRLKYNHVRSITLALASLSPAAAALRDAPSDAETSAEPANPSSGARGLPPLALPNASSIAGISATRLVSM